MCTAYKEVEGEHDQKCKSKCRLHLVKPADRGTGNW